MPPPFTVQYSTALYIFSLTGVPLCLDCRLLTERWHFSSWDSYSDYIKHADASEREGRRDLETKTETMKGGGGGGAPGSQAKEIEK